MARKGIIQSRGLGDIIIALPIARWYWEQGNEIIWPVCREFLGSLESAVPWVEWHGMEADPEGRFFLETPLQLLDSRGVEEDDRLYLYQYLSSVPELTDPELFSILKFDQYKYWVAAVPFHRKWQLRDCIVRDPASEQALIDRLGIEPGERIAVTHLTGSTFEARLEPIWLDPAVRVIRVEEWATESIWSWLGVLERAEAAVCIDSVFANMIDSWRLQEDHDIDLYWIRRSPWDLTPVLGSTWTVVPTELPIVKDNRVDPAALAQDKARRMNQGTQRSGGGDHALQAYAPFQAAGTIPTSFMHAVKKN